MLLIRSGIPALDVMFHPGMKASSEVDLHQDEYGIYLDDAGATTSICIAGPDGTGKSVLAMHYASRYLADCHEYCRKFGVSEPLALYVSSDLTHSKARDMWRNFRLEFPNQRQIPFRYPQIHRQEQLPDWLGNAPYDNDFQLELSAYEPDSLATLALHLHSPKRDPQVAFIDLASHTAGDDWGFIERLVAAMPRPNDAFPSAPRNMLLLDAMEGMETLAGEVDAFGQKATRRSRVAKLMRLAERKCHLVLIVEEPEESTRLVEQFVADVVLRLRATENHGYSRRTLEIEKARGQSIVRGRHPYVVRDGHGSTTGEQLNFDDPPVEKEGLKQGYLDLFPSLHSISRSIMENRAPGRDRHSYRRAGFGIEDLDEMLAKRAEGPTRAMAIANAENDNLHAHGEDESGLPCGAVSALIGDANTQKSFLGHAFLGHVFYRLALQLVTGVTHDSAIWTDEELSDVTDQPRYHYVKQLCQTKGPGERCDEVKTSELNPGVRRWARRIDAVGRGSAGAAVLVTTKDENNRTLANRFFKQLREETERVAAHGDSDLVRRVSETWNDPDFQLAFTAYLQSRTICRRLEIHDTPSAVLIHTIQRTIEAAQQIVKHDFADVCLGLPLHEDAAVRAKDGWRIRFVLDDFNSIMRTYGRVHDDPLFLPFLMVYLRREGLSSLIIETQSGAHGMPPTMIGDDAQSDLRALSDHRLYTWHITDFFGDHRIAIAAIPPMVQQDRKSPVVVRELEWYEPNGSSPPKVNPRFELYAGLDTNKPKLVPLRVHLYAESPAWKSYINGLDELWKRVFEPPDLGGEHRIVVVGERFDRYEMMHEVSGLLADTNLDYSLVIQIDEFWNRRDTFRAQSDYMTRRLSEPVKGEGGDAATHTHHRRTAWFDFERLGYQAVADAGEHLDRIPFVWDFGFLACREDLWEEAIHQGAQKGEERQKTAAVLASLTEGKDCNWIDVLRAASYVAEWESARQSRPVPAFDLAMVAPQTFSCLVLEMWFSEIYETNSSGRERLKQVMKERRWSGGADVSLLEFVQDYQDQLYCIWLLLAQSLDLGGFDRLKEGFGFAAGRDSNPNAIITRHWYKSAAALESGREKNSRVLYCRLPGHFSARGDWFLTTVRGSRSERLADRALDLLSTRDANIDRLMRGLGLPTRMLGLASADMSSRLRGNISRKMPLDRPYAGGGSRTLSYGDVRALGATSDKSDFHWLWRGNLKDYDAAARIWERWLYRMLRRWKRTREHFASDWRNGFELYKDFKDGKDLSDLVSPKDFPEQCKRLCGELQLLEG